MTSQEAVYQAAGFGGTVPRGQKPAILVVDFSYGFSDVVYPTAADMGKEIDATRQISDLARDKNIPVIYTTIAYHPAEIPALPWLRKAKGMAALLQGSRLVQIDERTGIQPGDLLLEKKGASAFHGTALSAILAGLGVDTVVITGATTSGCVRASAVDAVQYGFNVLVAADCCADRAGPPHNAALYDIHQKYGDVTDSADIIAWLSDISGK